MANCLPDEGFVRLPTVLAVFPVARSTWLAGVKSGRYPKPIRLLPRVVAWKVQDIRDLIEQHARGPGEGEGVNYE
jgi:prophage regulatory protein